MAIISVLVAADTGKPRSSCLSSGGHVLTALQLVACNSTDLRACPSNVPSKRRYRYLHGALHAAMPPRTGSERTAAMCAWHDTHVRTAHCGRPPSTMWQRASMHHSSKSPLGFQGLRRTAIIDLLRLQSPVVHPSVLSRTCGHGQTRNKHTSCDATPLTAPRQPLPAATCRPTAARGTSCSCPCTTCTLSMQPASPSPSSTAALAATSGRRPHRTARPTSPQPFRVCLPCLGPLPHTPLRRTANIQPPPRRPPQLLRPCCRRPLPSSSPPTLNCPRPQLPAPSNSAILNACS